MADTLQRINLNSLKHNGVYTFEVDESQNINLPLTTGRIVIGSSKKGPVNSVVSVRDLKTARLVFGDIDTRLEKAGSYFHRFLEISLREGPVYALNILPVDNEDKVWFSTFNTESSATNTDNTLAEFNQPFANFFNTQRLWYADGDQLSKTKNLSLGDDYIDNPATYGQVDADSNKILSFANLGKKPLTVWTRMADISGYDLTVKEYYGRFENNVQIPLFLHPDDMISDYFVEVIAIEGDWSDNVRLSNDPIWGQYFNERGLIRSKLNNFLAQREINIVTRTIGSLIPDFTDQSGSVVSVDTILNRIFIQTELLCSIDHGKLDLIELDQSVFSDSSMQTHRVDLIGQGYDQLNYMADDGSVTFAHTPVPMIDVLSYRQPGSKTLCFTVAGGALTEMTADPKYSIGMPGNSLFANPSEVLVVVDGVNPSYSVAYEHSTMYQAWKNGFIKTGCTVDILGVDHYVKIVGGFTATFSGTPYKYIKVYQYSDITLNNLEGVDLGAEINGNDISYSITNSSLSSFKFDFDLTDTNYFTSFDVLAPNKIQLGVAWANKAKVDEFIKPNNYIKAKLTADGRPRFLKILSVSSNKVLSPAQLYYTVTTMLPSASGVAGISTDGNILGAYKGVKNFVQEYKGVYLDSFKLIPAKHLPTGTALQQESILGFMYNLTNIAKTLADRETVDFRYIIDSYEGDLSGSSKYYLAKTAADHGQVLAILNAPSFSQFEKSVDPSFIDPVTKLVSPEFIALGGNLDLNPSFTFGFASGDKNGIPISTYAGYFMPNMIISDGGRNKSIPPAAYVGNAYMRKYTSGQPFSIVAAKRGLLLDPEIVQPEYHLTDEDCDFLQPAGFNTILKRRGFGNMIMHNATGYQSVTSALNNIHVREALITMEKDINRILFNFLFDFNDEITRLRVQSIVKNYLDAVLAARGISYYTVKIDASNNTNDIITNNAGIIDISVDFPRGIQKFINRITITRVGGQLSSSQTGFTPSF